MFLQGHTIVIQGWMEIIGYCLYFGTKFSRVKLNSWTNFSYIWPFWCHKTWVSTFHPRRLDNRTNLMLELNRINKAFKFLLNPKITVKFCFCSRVFHDKIKFYIFRQNLHQTCFNDFSNVKWCMKQTSI